ncbi:MAG: hypothetical protein GYA52_07275 [Chloroflexi bacterium]|nr:hypothetical protein [Chloroflexota bacterium]
MILCGAKQVDITPPIGIPLAGYGARKENSRGIHDPLLAQIIYLNDSVHELLLVGLDLVAVDADFVAQIRTGIFQSLQITPEAILVSCTHTHSGPDGYCNTFPRESANINFPLRQNTVEKLVGAAAWAKTSAREAKFSFGRVGVGDICLNRNDPAKASDKELSLLKIESEDETLALLVNYGCHPTVLGPENLLISADLPGAARKYFHKLFPETVLMFMNGGSGDVSTRFTRRSQDFKELDRFGLLLFSNVIQAMQTTQPFEVQRVASASSQVELPLRDFPSIEIAQEELTAYEQEFNKLKNTPIDRSELRKAETKIQGASAQLKYSKLFRDTKSIRSEIQSFKIGELACVTIPGEPFAGITLDIKAAFPDQPVMVISYANDYMGYFPIDEKNLTYETLKSPWALNIGEFLVENCEAMMSQLDDLSNLDK